jgi:methylmalonyl-CoA/ethylmalonyl-CoA epimerase
MLASGRLSIHHIGLAVADIETARQVYVDRFGYEVCSPIIHDPVQTAYVQFLRVPHDGVYLELIAPDSPESKLSAFVKKGGGLNHICYAVEDIESAVLDLRNRDMIAICDPVPAVAFQGRRIAWMMGMDMQPVELVECEAGSDSVPLLGA